MTINKRKRQIITNVGKHVEKLESQYIADDNKVKWLTSFENNLEVSQKVKQGVTISPTNSISRYISKISINIAT